MVLVNAAFYLNTSEKIFASFLSLLLKSLIIGKDLLNQKEVGIQVKRKHNNYDFLLYGEHKWHKLKHLINQK